VEGVRVADEIGTATQQAEGAEVPLGGGVTLLRPATRRDEAPGRPRDAFIVHPATAPAAAEPDPGLLGAELTLVIPTLNERDNIRPLLERLERVLVGERWEAMFVDDDSVDGTLETLREIARVDRRVRVVQRIGRRGLATACIEGALASAAPYIAVMDADLQHDETLLPRMLRKLRAEPLDIVVGSRYAPRGSIGAWSAGRARNSGVATKVSRLVLRADLADPMSGFFMVRRDAFDGAVRRLSGQGFKILLDLFASAPEPLHFAELPFRFGQRRHGSSKLDGRVAWEYLLLVADKLVGHVVPLRFLLFAAIGTLGVAVHLATLWAALALGLAFVAAQVAATLVAMTGNFALNNALTYRDRRLKGWRFLQGLVSFAAICAVGTLANVGVAAAMYREDGTWWLAGMAGALIGAVWNYAVSSVFTWRPRREF
jgi:dolichol-phosphate mannosyltransferase